MKTPSFGVLGFGAIALAGVTLLAIGTPDRRVAPPPAPLPAAPPNSVSASGFTLETASIELPVDDRPFPDGAHADIVNANCTSCHSASMALTQPALSADQWKAIVAKMRDVYKAPIADRDVPAIVTYLTSRPPPE